MATYWYLWLIFAALVVVTAVVIVFASRAVSSHNEETKRFMAEIDRLKSLKDKYKDLTPEKVENADSKELLDGVWAVLQARIEKAEDINLEFSTFNDAQKYVYVLSQFVEYISEDNLSLFFDGFDDNFQKTLISGLKEVGARSIYEIAQKEYEMYDDSNENVSFDKNVIAQLDEKFKEAYSENDLLEKTKAYIRNNIDKF